MPYILVSLIKAPPAFDMINSPLLFYIINTPPTFDSWQKKEKENWVTNMIAVYYKSKEISG
jgi:hypothetical protein